MQYLRLYYCTPMNHYKGISNNRFDPRGDTVSKSTGIAYAYLLSDYSKQLLKNPEVLL